MRKPLSKIQIIFIVLLWMALCYLVIVNARTIDGGTIITLLFSAALVFIPVYQSLKKK